MTTLRSNARCPRPQRPSRLRIEYSPHCRAISTSVFSPKLGVTRFPRNRILYEAGDATRYAYPNSGVASLLAITEDGRTIEFGSVGNEGYIGVPIVYEVGIAHYRVIVQMPVEAVRIEPHLLLAEVHRGGKLRELLSRYAHVLEIQMVQSLICHLCHAVSPRLCRYLLVTADRLHSEDFG